MNDQRFPVPQRALHEGLRVVLPGPPNVSMPGQPRPPGAPVGNMGVDYGIQRFGQWAAGNVVPLQLIDVTRADALWRVSAFGPVSLTLGYGTTKKREIVGLLAPLVITVPGQLELTAKPTDPDHAGVICIVTLTQATAGAISNARKFVDDSGGAVTLDAGAVRFVALEATVLSIGGVAVNLTASQFVPLVVGSSLTSGSGFQEFEA